MSEDLFYGLCAGFIQGFFLLQVVRLDAYWGKVFFSKFIKNIKLVALLSGVFAVIGVFLWLLFVLLYAEYVQDLKAFIHAWLISLLVGFLFARYLSKK